MGGFSGGFFLRPCYTHKKFKTSIKSWINIKKMNRTMKLDQEACLRTYIDIKKELRKNAKNFKKDFSNFKLMNNSVLEKWKSGK